MFLFTQLLELVKSNGDTKKKKNRDNFSPARDHTCESGGHVVGLFLLLHCGACE